MTNMSISVGVDIENTERFRDLNSDNGDQFLRKVYTSTELDYCFNKENPAQHLAGRFAAKEATYKAMEQIKSIDQTNVTEIEIRRNGGSGPPTIYAPEMQNIISSVSISYTTGTAIAVVLLLGQEETRQ